MEAASLTLAAGRSTARGRRLLRLRSDDQLVAQFRLGNEEAFRVIHDRYRARLFAYTRQMLAGSRSDAEDALQDVFLRAYGALRADDRPVTLRAWLYRVAHNRCIDQLRRPSNQPTGELYENLSSLNDPLADIQRRDDLRRLVEDVRRLPEQQRSALLMRELEGLSYSELADALGVTVPSVKSLLVRARIGLTEAREARDTACVEIRADLAAAQDKGVRMNGRAKRHLRECPGCVEHRARMKAVRDGFAALGPAPTAWGALAKLLGVGGAGGGAAATAGGSGGAIAGSTLVAGGTAKVAALVCCAAVVGGSAVEASHELVKRAPAALATPRAHAATHPRAVAAVHVPARVAVHASESSVAVTPAVAAPTRKHHKAAVAKTVPVVAEPEIAPRAVDPAAPEDAVLAGPSADADAVKAAAAGGMLAPDEAADPEPLTPAVPEDTGTAANDAPPTDGAATGTTGP